MAAWDSVDDLWWLKPSEKHVQPINSLALGARIRQQATENKLRAAQIILQAQRTDAMSRIAETNAALKIARFNDEASSVENLGVYLDSLSAHKPDAGDPPLPPSGLSTRDVAVATRAWTAWHQQTAVINRQKETTAALAARAKADTELFRSARELIEKGGPSLIEDAPGPNGTVIPVVDRTKLEIAWKAFNDKQGSVPNVPEIPGMTARTLRVKLSNGNWVTYERPEGGLDKEKFTTRMLPALLKSTLDATEATKQLEELWAAYQGMSGQPTQTNQPKIKWEFKDGQMIEVK